LGHDVDGAALVGLREDLLLARETSESALMGQGQAFVVGELCEHLAPVDRRSDRPH
jgi:hypothetical protein